jgi:FAD/FMN-containing dehydrogenase/Fe-S oxidoreductase
LDERQARLLDDLRDIVTGDVLVDDLSRAAYSTDASILQVRPQAVVAPRTVDELCGVIRYAADAGLSIHPRGAGTGLAGESLGSGLVIDCTRHLDHILEVGPDTVRVEPGVRWTDVQNRLKAAGRMFPPDPVSGDRCTIGGMIATNAAGPHALRYGATRDYVLRVRAVLASGELVEFGQEPLLSRETGQLGTVAHIAREVAAILSDHALEVAYEQTGRLLKPGGYYLRGLLENGSIDLARLLVGSEGTLAVLAEATLATLALPEHRGVLLACCQSLDAAAQAVVESLEDQPTACELLDRRLVTMIRDSNASLRKWIPDDAEALLLIEQEGRDEENVRERVRRMADRLGRVHRLASETVGIFAEPELSLCWRVRHQASGMLSRRSGPEQPIPFVENAAVPPAQLPTLLKRVQDVMKRHEVTASYVAHAGVGILHTRPMLNLARPDHRAKLESIALEVQQAALELGGTNNGEHGVGMLRSSLIPLEYRRLYPVFCKLKAVFDPHNRLNPGKIVGAEPGFPLAHLREAPAAGGSAVEFVPRLAWSDLSVLEAADRCNGCGSCQAALDPLRMCPTYKVWRTELASPRSKANLMRQVLRGAIDPRTASSDEFRAIADFCVHCKMCRVECPSAVDISKLMLEAKAANVAEHGLSRTDWVFAHLEGIAIRASANAVFVNALLQNWLARWVLEKTVGISRRRRIPRFHHNTFLRRASRLGLTRKPRSTELRPKVALFADLFVNHLEPHLGEYAVRVLEHLGRKVYVPPGQRASGMTALQVGDVETARACVEANLEAFAELAREGFDVVCLEPTTALVFRDEARNLLTSSDLALLSQQTYEFSEYLAVVAQRGELRNGLEPVRMTIGYHEPCHERALGPRGSIVALLERIPELRVIPIELGCSGMAGTWGLRANSFEASCKAGSAMLNRLAADDIHFGATQCAACRMQMEQGSHKRTLHPAEWFAIAYGLVKHPQRLLRAGQRRSGTIQEP